MTNLIVLAFDHTQLNNIIRTDLGMLTDLRVLDMAGNQLIKGTIPSELGKMSLLWDLRLSDCQLVGALPSELGQMTSLIALDLHGNNFSGEIPSEMARLTNLVTAGFHSNLFVAPNPPALFCEIESLERFFVDCNETELLAGECGCDSCVCYQGR